MMFLRSLITLAFFPILIITQPVYAASQIGVTAALKGEVIRVSSPDPDVAVGALSSGQKIYLGDQIEVPDTGRLQIMLMDETVFTLGSGASMVMDEFIYDPASQTGTLSANISKGAFRFVSGKLAKSSPDAMKVVLPSATLSVRGTQVAGLIEDDGTTQIVLIGPGANDFGAGLGAISVSNELGTIEIDRANYATTISADGSAPTPPVVVDPQIIRVIEIKTLEDAEIAIAEELKVDDLKLVAPTDSDGDGRADVLAANTELSKIVADATKDSGATTDKGVLAAVFISLIGEDALKADATESNLSLEGTNLGGGVADLLETGAKYSGDTTLAELESGVLTGSVTYNATNVAMACQNSSADGCGGSYDVSDTWNFAGKTLRQVITNGEITVDVDGSGAIDNKFTFSIDKTIDYSSPSNYVPSEPAYATLSVTFKNDTGTPTVLGGAINISTDSMVNTVAWSPTPGSDVKIESTMGDGDFEFLSMGYLSNFEIAGEPKVGNVASHDLKLLSNGTTLATGVVAGMSE